MRGCLLLTLLLSFHLYVLVAVAPSGDTTAMASSATIGAPQPTAGGSSEVDGERKKPASDSNDLTSNDVVAFSSRLIAAVRAIESRREDRLFNDAFAERLAGREAMQLREERRSSQGEGGEGVTDAEPARTPASGDESATGVLSPVKKMSMDSRRLSIRTRFCDDFFEDCTMSRGMKQVVLLGAGMDTRGLRLRASPDTKVFEVDQAVVLRVKRELLSAPGLEAGVGEKDAGLAKVVGVEADLSIDGWQGELLEEGFDPKSPSAWILEGLTMYFEESSLKGMMRVVDNLCAPGSALCATFVGAGSVEGKASSGSDLLRAWKFGSDDPVAFMEALFSGIWSFRAVACGSPGEYPDGADYGVGYTGKGSPFVVGFSRVGQSLGAGSRRENIGRVEVSAFSNGVQEL